MRVGIIGAGAGGLIAGHTLRNHGFGVTIFERNSYSGGVWKYKHPTDKKQRKVDPMYKNLVTNLPKEIMAYNEQEPFDSSLPSFMSHHQVQDYLEHFSHKHNLSSHIQYSSEVIKCYRDKLKWKVEYRHQNHENDHQLDDNNGTNTTHNDNNIPTHTSVSSNIYCQEFDYLLVCNGHYNQPFIPTDIDNLHTFTGEQVHSVEYNTSGDYSMKRVLVVGSRSSGTDIAREVSHTASIVYVSDRNMKQIDIITQDSNQNTKEIQQTSQAKNRNIYHYSSIRRIIPHTNQVEFICGTIVTIDVIIWATGYLYHYPFLHDYMYTLTNHTTPLISSSSTIPTTTTSTTTTSTTTNNNNNNNNTTNNTDITISTSTTVPESSPPSQYHSPTWKSVPLTTIGSRIVPQLYHQLLSIHEPTLAFIGLPYSVIPFPLFYIQSLYLSSLFRTYQFHNYDRNTFENTELHQQMKGNVKHHEDMFYEKYQDLSRYYHYLGGSLQFEYMRTLLSEIHTNSDKINYTGTTKQTNTDGSHDVHVDSTYVNNTTTSTTSSCDDSSVNDKTCSDHKISMNRLYQYLQMIQEIYTDVGLNRPPYVGAPDEYRKRQYIVDRSSLTWSVKV